MFKHWKLAVVAASLLVGGTAFAQPAPDQPQHRHHAALRGAHRIAKFDLNKDGKLDATERLAMQKEKFAKLDKNKDGVLSFDEAQPLLKHRGGREGRNHAGKKPR